MIVYTSPAARLFGIHVTSSKTVSIHIASYRLKSGPGAGGGAGCSVGERGIQRFLGLSKKWAGRITPRAGDEQRAGDWAAGSWVQRQQGVLRICSGEKRSAGGAR